jgi:hypothetical protein
VPKTPLKRGLQPLRLPGILDALIQEQPEYARRQLRSSFSVKFYFSSAESQLIRLLCKIRQPIPNFNCLFNSAKIRRNKILFQGRFHALA